MPRISFDTPLVQAIMVTLEEQQNGTLFVNRYSVWQKSGLNYWINRKDKTVAPGEVIAEYALRGGVWSLL